MDRPQERLDDLQNGYTIIQDPDKFCFGVDAVLISNFVDLSSPKPQTILDLCSGNGIIPLLLHARKANQVTGLELNIENVHLAQRSFAYNSLTSDLSMLHGDLKDIKTLLKGQKFDIVTANPPYMPHGNGLLNSTSDVAIARHEIFCTFDDVVQAAAYVLNHGGWFYFIHRPQRLTELLATVTSYNLEPKTIQFIHGHIDTEATMVMVACRRGAKPGLKLLPPKIMYER